MTIAISLEFFPPNTPEGERKLRETRARLLGVAPEFFSVTYGAGGATRDKTVRTVFEIAAEGLAVAPHLSCVGATRGTVAELLDQYRMQGIRHLVALRGDLPSGMVDAGDFRYAADLVAFIRQHSADWFDIKVAAYPEVHPQATSAQADLQAFVAKMRAGANSAITQYFFNNDAFLRFRDEVAHAGVIEPVVPGIMPITNFRQLARFSDACGAEIPRWIRSRLEQLGEDLPAIRRFGADVIGAQVQRLIAEGVTGLHVYTMNQADPTLEILTGLRAGQT
jgi:methylenetetrahydrofolate reductase (NADPH)